MAQPGVRGGWARATLALMLLAGARAAGADDTASSWRDNISLILSNRVRGEVVDWFRPPPGLTTPGAQRYSFFGNQFRVGFRAVLPHFELVLVMQDTELLSLPDDASLKPPQGNLGPGAVYFANTHSRNQGEPFLKLGALSYRTRGFTATAGRFEIRDGLETVPADPSLALLIRQRIAERLVGPFDYTMVTRSFDGVRLTLDRPLWNVTAVAVRPTAGGFEVSANREISDISLAGLSLSLRRFPPAPEVPASFRLFYLYYEDDRRDVLKVDNRPLAVRAADHDAIAIHTLGAHAVAIVDAGPGKIDGLAWGAVQAGQWGKLDHSAWAWALEAGYQLPRLPASPWLRAGVDRSSGDANPNDRFHETFFQILPTARIYAQLPFYNLMNNLDVFTQLLLRPHPRIDVRTDWHWLRLTQGQDLWYSGGGATNDDIFGYAGSPANGERNLAHLLDVSVTTQVARQVTLYVYFGHAFGQSVVSQTFASTGADYGFAEVTYRY